MRFIKYIFAVILLFSLFGCRHKDIFDTATTDLLIVFDWRYAPEAKPESMRLLLYPENGNEPIPFDFSDYHGGHIRVPNGKYKALCYNSDSEFITITNINDPDKTEATLPTIALRARSRVRTLSIMTPTNILPSTVIQPSTTPYRSPDEERTVSPPEDYFYSDFLEPVNIYLVRGSQVVTLYPRRRTAKYRVEFRNAKNLELVSNVAIQGSLTALSGGIKVKTGEKNNESVTMPFGFHIEEGIGLVSDFLNFGEHKASNSPHVLVMWINQQSGGRLYYNFDVTDQIRKAKDPFNVVIVIDGFTFPQLIYKPNGGIGADVSNWQDEYVDLPVYD